MRGYNYNGVDPRFTPTGGDRAKLSPGPSSSPVVWNPETDIPEGNRPRAPLRRSEGFVLVGTYELVIEDAGTRYRRLNLTSVPRYVKDDEQLSNVLTDALNDVSRIEHELDPAAVFSVIGADTFEEELEEGRLL